MNILIATPEAVPYAKTGGLADVTGSLLKEFRQMGVNASLILPLYKSTKNNFDLYPTGKVIRIAMGGISITGGVWLSENSPRPEAYFIECEELYGRPELYGTAVGDYPDNALRFAFFSRAVLEMCLALDIRPDLIHCNDWQTAMLPLYIKTLYTDKGFFRKTATLYTFHNLGYQGLFDAADMKYTGMGWDYFTPEGIEFYGRVNFMKAGLLYADLLSTVSKTYAREVLETENGFGLDGVLKKRKEDFSGVLNGIDYNEWDPERDTRIAAHYSTADIRGKAICKRTLVKEIGFDEGKSPLFGIVSRFSAQKGLDLFAVSVERLVAMGLKIIVLGRGEDYYQKLLVDIAKKHGGDVFLKVGFEDGLARLIYAGCDFFLMPSRYEPCGLGQLIALRYGTIPIARKTGGLADTIDDDTDSLSEGNGFLFSDYTSSALQGAVARALAVYGNRKRMKNMISTAMKADFSWKKSAEKYLELYKKGIKKVRI
jgi:starch synthase